MSNVAKLSLDASVTLNGTKFTLQSAAKHVLAVYDLMSLRNEEQIDAYKEIGDLLLQIETFCEGNKQAMGKRITALGLDVISAPDRSDARFIATNWADVAKLREAGTIDGLGVSAIRKRIKTLKGESKPQAGKAKAAPKGEGKPEGSDKPESMTEADLAKLVAENVKTYGLSVPAFVKALQAELAKG